MKRLAAIVLLAAASLWAYATPTPFPSLLEEADSLRSVDPQRFRSLLGELNGRIAEATPAQREHLAYLKAYEQAYTGRYDLAIQEASALFESSKDDSLRFRAGLLVANSYAATREFAAGLGFMDKSLALMERIGDRQLRHDGMTVAALLYNQVGQYELGRQFAEQILGDQPGPRTRCFAGYLRLEANQGLYEFLNDPAPVEQLIALCVAEKEILAANMARGHLARLYAGRGEIGPAIELLEAHLAEAEGTRYPRLVGEIHSLLAEFRLARGDLATAEQHARKAISASVANASSLPVVNAYRILYEIALKRGDADAALEHYRDFAQADKAYLDDIKARELAFQLAKHETLQKNQTIELLNRQNRVLTLEQEVAAKTAQANRLLIVLLAFLLATIGYFAYKTKKTQLSFRRLAETDALTGISNRHHFSRRAEQALDYCRKSGEDVGLVMFDLDDFKGINDRYGHAVGDWVLKEVAAACREACRKNDLVGRLGGEEFAFLLVGCDLAASTELARECRKRIAAIETSPTGKVFRVTASFGVAGSAHAGHDFHVLLARADEAMYRSKHEGRDRVSVHEAAPATH